MKKGKSTMIKSLVIGMSSAILFLVVCSVFFFIINILASIVFFMIAFFPWLIVTGLIGDCSPKH